MNEDVGASHTDVLILSLSLCHCLRQPATHFSLNQDEGLDQDLRLGR
jgi:hypothetical protein